jgi:hypothetical protein
MPCPANELGVVPPFVAARESEDQFEAVLVRIAMDGDDVLVARAGTACRPPTVGEKKKQRRRPEASGTKEEKTREVQVMFHFVNLYFISRAENAPRR